MLSPPANKKVLSWLLLATLLLFAFIIWLVFIARNSGPDEKIFNAIAPHINEYRTSFMKRITFLGNHGFLIPANLIFIAYLLGRRGKWDAIAAAIIALSSLVSMSFLKNLVGRHRPPNPLVEGITNFSFPSGHAYMSVAFYGMLVWWVSANTKNKWLKHILIVFLLLLILLIGFSRIYLRVHYTTDVIAGFCLGSCWLIFCLFLIEKIRTPASVS